MVLCDDDYAFCLEGLDWSRESVKIWFSAVGCSNWKYLLSVHPLVLQIFVCITIDREK